MTPDEVQYAIYEYVQDMDLNSSQVLSYQAAHFQALVILIGFVIVFGLICIMQGRPRG